MTTPLITDSAPNPDAPAGFRPRLSGRCTCCGQAETRSLFAMGHDARFRGFLQRALAGVDVTPPVSPNWNNRVDWWIDGTCALRMTITDALAAIDALIGRDWAEKVVHGASRLTRKTVSAPPSRPHVPTGDTSAASIPDGAFEPVEARVEQRMDELMARLDRPMAGRRYHDSRRPAKGSAGTSGCWPRPANSSRRTAASTAAVARCRTSTTRRGPRGCADWQQWCAD